MVFIPIDTRRVLPPSPSSRKIKAEPVEPVQRKGQSAEQYSERRKRRDRRKQPFEHRGAYEMRSGGDRREAFHVNEEV